MHFDLKGSCSWILLILVLKDYLEQEFFSFKAFRRFESEIEIRQARLVIEGSPILLYLKSVSEGPICNKELINFFVFWSTDISSSHISCYEKDLLLDASDEYSFIFWHVESIIIDIYNERRHKLAEGILMFF